MAIITINRAHQFANRFRSYRILVNGKEKVRLSYNEKKSITLPAGTYTICAKIDWLRSEEYKITLGEPDNVTLEIGCTMTITNYQKAMDVLFFVVLFGSILEYETIVPIAWVLLLGISVLRHVVFSKQNSFLYYLTKGRSRYLYISTLDASVFQ